jgi:sugar phosphate isomerase/epimerase
MKMSQVAAQLYTLRDHFKTVAEAATTLKKVRAIGYTAVQASGVSHIQPAEFRKLASDAGLSICATHEDPKLILNEPTKVVGILKAIGSKDTAYPYPADIDFGSMESVDTLARKLDAAGEVLAKEGLRLTYHNHAIEFVRLPNGALALDYILDHTRPAYLMSELDTYWAHKGGVDVTDYILKLQGRLPLLHMKDYRLDGRGEPTFAEIGKGTLNFAEIVCAAEEVGCEWFIVEQDVCPIDPFDSLRISYDYIASHLAS